MPQGRSLSITPKAAAELGRQASFARTPGLMHIDLVRDKHGGDWMHIRLRPGDLKGIPLARAEGVTLYAPPDQVETLSGLCLNYYGDLSGGSFLISTPGNAEGCSCGSGFRFSEKTNLNG